MSRDGQREQVGINERVQNYHLIRIIFALCKSELSVLFKSSVKKIMNKPVCLAYYFLEQELYKLTTICSFNNI